MTSPMHSQFQTDPIRVTDGIWFDYGPYRVKTAFAGDGNQSYLKYAEAKTKPWRRAINAGTMSDRQSRELMYDIFAQSVVKDWEIDENWDTETGARSWVRGIHASDGSINEFSKENVIKAFRELPHLFFDLNEQATNMQLYLAEIKEADSKN